MALTNKVLVLPAPAKLNLFLHITGRREDGYHNLQTVFQLIDYSDQIELRVNTEQQVSRGEKSDTEKNHISYDKDLCVRAALLLQEFCGTSLGAEITLKKRLPIGGGVGGGSSNAATVLCGLNTLWNCQIDNDQLAQLGTQLGADVPVFIRGFSSWAEGVGEELTPLQLESPWFLVIDPKIFVSTAKIFADKALTRDCDSFTISRFLEGNRSELFNNVFESVVTKKYPEISKAIAWLNTYSPARLTGTGCCIFASFKSKDEASKVLDELLQSPHNWDGFVAKGINESPLHKALRK